MRIEPRQRESNRELLGIESSTPLLQTKLTAVMKVPSTDRRNGVQRLFLNYSLEIFALSCWLTTVLRHGHCREWDEVQLGNSCPKSTGNVRPRQRAMADHGKPRGLYVTVTDMARSKVSLSRSKTTIKCRTIWAKRQTDVINGARQQ